MDFTYFFFTSEASWTRPASSIRKRVSFRAVCSKLKAVLPIIYLRSGPFE